ncbi:hypothetical protein [Rhizobium leguminosarum]|uniref:hypothetical protein n=1 Tax=Rhizobium leguminosarum TaxID=384 RepID=UPI001C906503|nr:hypothetical protein [Rhizobium leguminosarum]MBY2908574.1 hypothetical protein [Rhizobium leguminosarum]
MWPPPFVRWRLRVGHYRPQAWNTVESALAHFLEIFTATGGYRCFEQAFDLGAGERRGKSLVLPFEIASDVRFIRAKFENDARKKVKAEIDEQVEKPQRGTA